jgi:penicillin-binding protein-related factor A (putative recombinase)
MSKNKLPNIQAILGQDALIENIQIKLEEVEELAANLGIKDIFRNKKFIEVAAAHRLGHRWSDKPYGADAYEEIKGITYPTEYKSARAGGSFQFHWLSVTKMKKIQECKNIYFLVTKGVRITEIYKLPTSKILLLIAEKASGGKSINGHKSFGLPQLITLGAERVD